MQAETSGVTPYFIQSGRHRHACMYAIARSPNRITWCRMVKARRKRTFRLSSRVWQFPSTHGCHDMMLPVHGAVACQHFATICEMLLCLLCKHTIPASTPPPLFVLFFIQKVRPNEFLIRAKFKTQQLPNNLGSPGKQFHASIRCRAGGHVFVRIVAGFL